MTRGRTISLRTGNEGIEVVDNFCLLGSNINKKATSSREIHHRLAFGTAARKTLATFIPKEISIMQAMVFLGILYGSEGWTFKKQNRKSIDVFELWSQKRPLRTLWTSNRSTQSFHLSTNDHVQFILFQKHNAKTWPSGKGSSAGKGRRKKNTRVTNSKAHGLSYSNNECIIRRLERTG